MEEFSKTKKTFHSILNIIINAALLYTTYTILFVTYIVWLANLLLFGLHILTIIMVLFVIFASDKDRESVRLNKSLPISVHVIIYILFITMFVAAGWFYYAILCMLWAFADYAVYTKKT